MTRENFKAPMILQYRNNTFNKNNKQHLIVCFSEWGCGHVMRASSSVSSCHPVGYYSSDWVMSDFQELSYESQAQLLDNTFVIHDKDMVKNLLSIDNVWFEELIEGEWVNMDRIGAHWQVKNTLYRVIDDIPINIFLIHYDAIMGFYGEDSLILENGLPTFKHPSNWSYDKEYKVGPRKYSNRELYAYVIRLCMLNGHDDITDLTLYGYTPDGIFPLKIIMLDLVNKELKFDSDIIFSGYLIDCEDLIITEKDD
jgi:hypothetical protein